MKNRLLFAPLAAIAMATIPFVPALADSPKAQNAAVQNATTQNVALFGSFDGVDFGDDAGEFARDGECDDLRFTGDGMTATPLLPDDIFRDASDCKAAFQSGKVDLNPLFIRLSGAAEIDWGDDASEFARDGECDDLRFEGPGLTETPLLAGDIGHDASDCRAAFGRGQITWRMGAIGELEEGAIVT